MNNLIYLINDDYTKNGVYNADNIEYVSYYEKIDYLKYKNGGLIPNTEEEKLNYEVLTLLENMGFSINKLGIYFYKDVILKILKILEKVEDFDNVANIYNNYLKQELTNPYSQFYFDLARNEYDLGIKTFHMYIENSLSSLDDEKEQNQLLLTMLNDNEEKLCYGTLAYKIALYIINNKQNTKTPFKKKVKVNDI